jgi:hypothetical protein
MKTYHVAAETGSCSPDYKRWEEKATCGHNHKTVEAAEKCKEKLQRSYCQHGRIAGMLCRNCLGGIARSQETSALWYNATIHNQDGERLEQQGYDEFLDSPEHLNSRKAAAK